MSCKNFVMLWLCISLLISVLLTVCARLFIAEYLVRFYFVRNFAFEIFLKKIMTQQS